MFEGDGRISVVTAVFNGEETLAAALESVRLQRNVIVEQIVVDGGSTDRTVDIAKAAGAPVTRLVSERDRGIYDALNKGLQLAEGKIVGLLHADDEFAHPAVLDQVMREFDDPATMVVYGDLQYVSREQSGKVVRHWRSGPYSRGRLRWGWMPPHPTVFMRRSLWERVGPYDLSYGIAADYEHMLRFLTDPSVHVRYIPEVLVRMKVGGTSNRSVRNILQKSREDLRAMRAHQVGGIGTLLAKNLRKVPQFF